MNCFNRVIYLYIVTVIDMPLGFDPNVGTSSNQIGSSNNSSPVNRYIFLCTHMRNNQHCGICFYFISRKFPKTRIPCTGSSCRSSIQMHPINPLIAGGNANDIEYGALPDGSIATFDMSNTSLDKEWLPPPNQKDDLYLWMAKAHNETKKNSSKEKLKETERPVSPPRPVAGGTSINGMMQESVRLLDAHLIFEPILTCLGVMPQQMINNISNSGKFYSPKCLKSFLKLYFIRRVLARLTWHQSVTGRLIRSNAYRYRRQ